MKIKKLSLIEETEIYYIFEITYTSFFSREIRRKALKQKNLTLPHWVDNGNIIFNYEGINAWLSTNKKDLIC